jgi:hypothetical protein
MPLFYKKVVPLSKEQHKKLYLEPVEGFAFATGTNSLYVAAAEFPRASREYPIVFGGDNQGGIFPVVLLGLKKNQNLFVDKSGKWNADYIPAYARRYPFILATPDAKKNQFTVCIDEAYPGFNTAKEGQPLFDAKGADGPVLKQAVDFLKDYQSHVRLTEAFCKKLQELGILEPVQANVSMKSGQKFSIAGFQCVSRAKLKELAPKTLAELAKSDQLELIYCHLQSLNNINNLTKKLGA